MPAAAAGSHHPGGQRASYLAPHGAGRKASSSNGTAGSDDDGQEEEWDESLPKPRPGEVGVTKRTLQNRKAQREFRKRREARVRDLEERCRRFDEMGLEANAELQKVARRLKEENDALRNVMTRNGLGRMIAQAMEEMRSKAGAAVAGVAPDSIKAALEADPNAMEYTLGGQVQGIGKVGGRQTQKGQKESPEKVQQPPAPVDGASRGQGIPLTAAPSGANMTVPAVPGENVNPNMLHQLEDVNVNMMPVVSPKEQRGRTSRDVNQILHLNLGGGQDANPNATTLSIMDAVNKPPPAFGDFTGEGAAGSSMLRNNPAFGRQNMPMQSNGKDRTPAINVATSQALGLDSSSKWLQPVKLSGTNTPGGNGGVNLFPLPQPTHTSDALLNPNPIPFAFNLNASTPADPQTWWQQLELGGAVLPPRQTADGDDVLDEKAAMFAEAQRQKQIQLARDNSSNSNAFAGASTSNLAGPPANSAQSPFDLNMFLNGAFTPGGGFSLNGAGGAPGGESAITPNLLPGSNAEQSVLWAQPSGQQQGGNTPVGQNAELLPQTEHAQLFLRLLEKKAVQQDNMKEYERLGFRPPAMTQTGRMAPPSSANDAERVSMKRKASSDDSMRMPAPATQRSRKMTGSNSTGQLLGKGKAAESASTVAAESAAGSIYSRLSQHPSFLSTNVYELEELVDAMGDSNLPGYGGKQQPSPGRHPQQGPRGPSPSAADRGSSSASMSPLTTASAHSEHRSPSNPGGVGQSPARSDADDAKGDGSDSRRSSSSVGSMERAFGYLDRKYASDAAAASNERIQQGRSMRIA